MAEFTLPVRSDDLERVRGVLAGEVEPAPARPASTVALVRDAAEGGGGVEVYLMRRVPRMAFAPGMHVFPGGAVEPEDHAGEDVGWSGHDAGWWARAFGVDSHAAAALLRAARRETAEECGIRLDAGPGPAGLMPLAHWITPRVEPRRFDTYFFLAALPAGQHCTDLGGEADERLWIRPGDAFARQLPMLPPTAVVLADLMAHPDVATALAARRRVDPVHQEYELRDGRLHLRTDRTG